MITEILFYYLIFCIATTLVTLARGVHPVLKEKEIGWEHKIWLYCITAILAILIAPVFFFLILFFPKAYREALSDTLDEHF
ncbi:MAG TPA: hypothetical protein VLB82_11350 [Thermodesulfobacteriota bacterium]|nr:hypothetical protein [Thermodesulfobacteriota bacterium]